MSTQEKSTGKHRIAVYQFEAEPKAEEIKKFLMQAIDETKDLNNLNVTAIITEVKNSKLGKVLIIS